MAGQIRTRELIQGDEVRIETYIDGAGSTFVILPSYGRDGGDDFDDITDRLAGKAWRILRPQPRGVAGSEGPMDGLTLHDLAEDVAMCIRRLCDRPVVILGHAFGNFVARAVATDHPDLVKAVVLASAGASKVPEDIAKTPFVAGDTSAPEPERLAALRKGFFAPNHDARIWLRGWYPATLKMQHESVERSQLSEFWACGTVPLLQVIGEYDPFSPKEYRNEMREQLGSRVTISIVEDASHALFPEQPDTVAEAVLGWAARYQGS